MSRGNDQGLFLFNLFNDKAIISVPQPFRWLLAKLISTRRAPVAKEIYGEIGGRSPIVPLTQQQAAALEKRLNEKVVFISIFKHLFELGNIVGLNGQQIVMIAETCQVFAIGFTGRVGKACRSVCASVKGAFHTQYANRLVGVFTTRVRHDLGIDV